jgi:hypothetical protein
MRAKIMERWTLVLVTGAVLAGCVIVPYKPAAEVAQTREVALDSAHILVTLGPRQMIEEFTEAIEDEDKSIQVVPPQEFIDVAFVDQDMTLAKLLDPATCSRIHERLGTDFAVLIGETTQYATDEHGGMIAYLGIYGAATSKEHTSSLATVIDIENAAPLCSVNSHAQGTSVGVGAFYGLFVVPMTGSSARDGLARGVVSAMRERKATGPLRIAVLAAERTSAVAQSP